jgi:heme-degrading monooxygenase HmoA
MKLISDQIVLMSFFRFPAGERIWGMKQMRERAPVLNNTEGITFHKMLGTGGGDGYGILPDFNTYALLTVWEDSGKAYDFEESSESMKEFREHTDEVFSIFMRPFASRGKWSGKNPFQAVVKVGKRDRIAVLTRATLKPKYYIPFWKRVKAVSYSHIQSAGLLFSKGIGERPWIMQATFTIWNDEDAMIAFAHEKSGRHFEAITTTRNKKGFREELYARFKVEETRGSYNGKTL